MTDEESKKRGRPRIYSDLAIETCHTLRLLQKQALRQTQGFVSSIISLLGLKLTIPDHTTLSRRLQTVVLPKVSSSKKSVMVIVDSTGLKVAGEKEWMNYKHGMRQRKVWRKLHLAIDGLNYRNGVNANYKDNFSKFIASMRL